MIEFKLAVKEYDGLKIGHKNYYKKMVFFDDGEDIVPVIPFSSLLRKRLMKHVRINLRFTSSSHRAFLSIEHYDSVSW